MNPATTFQAFIALLRTSLNLASKIRQPRRPAQHVADESGDNDIFYTDRQYNRQRKAPACFSAPSQLGRSNRIQQIDPVNKPAAPPRAADTTDSERALIWKEHRRELLTWKNNVTETRNIILERLSTKVWPREYVRLSAKDLYDSVAKTRKESASKPYLEALRQFYNVRLNITANHCCDAFLTAYQNVNTAAETLSSGDENPVDRSIPEATAAEFFILGTMHLPELSTWRDHKAVDSTDMPVSLHSMMSSLRNTTFSEYNGRQSTPAHAAPARPVDLNAPCRKCAHNHLNKQCYKQNPY
ncbi:hypothetical protein K3495_g8346 [Podosphaera aphanis]|nr:hypothetical protein K3495_g8346 [Podosphaera aphanis]